MNTQLRSTLLIVSNLLGCLSVALLLSEPCPKQQDLSMTIDDCASELVLQSNGV